MKSFIAKRVISILVNLRYLRFKLLKYTENNKKICYTCYHNFKNIPLYSVYQKKVYTFQKSPHINISTYFQEIFIHVGSYMSLLSNDTEKSDNILCLSEQEPHL